jgi:hypothetical protein
MTHSVSDLSKRKKKKTILAGKIIYIRIKERELTIIRPKPYARIVMSTKCHQFLFKRELLLLHNSITK